MHHMIVFLVCFFLAGYVNVLHCAEPAADSYEQALYVWKTPEEINTWIAANFSYDMARALQLSETQRPNNEKISIYDPFTFFDKKTGTCVDLSRFAFETLRRIDQGIGTKYLMIEFDPITRDGNVLRLHWMVSFRRDGKTYFFADSNRPGHMAGPYNDAREFINDYEQYRNRKIISFRELESYQKQQRTPAQKRQTQEKKP
jgi:hypothetical protein